MMGSVVQAGNDSSNINNTELIADASRTEQSAARDRLAETIDVIENDIHDAIGSVVAVVADSGSQMAGARSDP